MELVAYPILYISDLPMFECTVEITEYLERLYLFTIIICLIHCLICLDITASPTRTNICSIIIPPVYTNRAADEISCVYIISNSAAVLVILLYYLLSDKMYIQLPTMRIVINLITLTSKIYNKN